MLAAKEDKGIFALIRGSFCEKKYQPPSVINNALFISTDRKRLGIIKKYWDRFSHNRISLK